MDKPKYRLREKCTTAKHDLSTAVTTNLDIDNLYEGEDLLLEISRGTFEDVSAHLFEKCTPSLVDAMEAARLAPKDIDDIVMVGGSTRIPKVKELIAEYFNKNPESLNYQINPD